MTNDAGSTWNMPSGDRQPSRRRAPRGWRLWALRALMLVAAPLLVFGVAEIGLRLLDVGHPTGFLLRNGDLYVPNPWFQWQFSPLPSHLPAVSATPMVKPAGTFRVVVVGESAAYGTPIPAFSFVRMLEVMLERRHPTFKFDVVNAAVPGINSHALLRVVKDTTVLRPDVYVIYMGNNEVTGCYGVGTIDSHLPPKLWLIRSAIAARALRIGQALSHLIPARGWSMRAEDIRGVQDRMALVLSYPVTRDDPRLRVACDTFHANLEDMLTAAGRAGARVVMSTVACNLRDWPPFASRHRPGLAAPDLEQWRSLYEAGVAAQGQERWAAAVANLRQAAVIDDRHAELHFRLGQCLLALGERDEAHEHLRTAMALDTFRVRTDENLNGVIRDVAAAHDGQGVRLVDAEAVFARAARNDGIPGGEFFFDHVHMTLEGKYQLASAVLGDVEAALGLKAPAPDDRPDLAAVEQMLSLTPWDRAQIDNATKMFVRYYTRAGPSSERTRPLSPMEAASTRQMYRDAIARDPDDLYLRERVALFLKEQSAWRESDAHLRLLVRKVPQWWDWHIQRAQLQVKLGQYEEAVDSYTLAARLNPHREMLWMELASTLSELGRTPEVIDCLRKAIAANPRMPVPHVNLGHIYMEQRAYRAAHDAYREAARLAPESPEVIGRLAWFYATVPLHELRNGSAAAELAERACALTNYEDIDMLTILSESYAAAGRSDDAITTAEKAVAMAREGDRRDLLARLEHVMAPIEAVQPSP